MKKFLKALSRAKPLKGQQNKMDVFEKERKYYPFIIGGEKLAEIDRTFSDDICIKLNCGYKQRFFVDIDDLETFKRCVIMKDKKIKSS